MSQTSDINPEVIEVAYRLFFGRKPENQDVVLNKVANFKTLAQLREAFLSSSEFLRSMQNRGILLKDPRSAKPFVAGETTPLSEINPEVIEVAYRLFFGRKPENQDVVLNKVANFKTLAQLREAFLSSIEFVRTMQNRGMLSKDTRSGEPFVVQIEADKTKLDQLFLRIKDQWMKLGESEPYWSVFTKDKFKRASFDLHKEEFFQSGASVADLFKKSLTTHGISVPEDSTCFELGCGVGRITAHLAGLFAKMIASDISKGNLAICREVLKKAKIRNVETRLFDAPTDILGIPPFQVFISFIVLQHNPPPVQYFLLDHILSKITRGGVAFFQIPVYKHDYHYSIDEYLSSDKPIIEMHCLPMNALIKLFHKHNFSVFDIVRDTWTGADFHSYTFFAVKE